jgi:hypothetical protein
MCRRGACPLAPLAGVGYHDTVVVGYHDTVVVGYHDTVVVGYHDTVVVGHATHRPSRYH